MKLKHLITLWLMLQLPLVGAVAQQVNDSNTPLHLMKPAYTVGYGVSKPSDVKQTMDRVLSYISTVTPPRLVNSKTGKVGSQGSSRYQPDREGAREHHPVPLRIQDAGSSCETGIQRG